jgi:hypothetical protein
MLVPARGPYSAPLAATAVTTTADIFHVTATAENPFILLGFELYNTTDLGDAQEEVLQLEIARGTTGGGTGGSALTEVHYIQGSGATVQTAVVGFNTTVSTGGTVLARKGWNVRIPFEFYPIPELRLRVDSAQDPLVVRLMSAPADSITIGGTIYWFEA